MKNFASLLCALLAFATVAHAKLNVVATTPDFGAIAREIGGDKIDLTTIARPTEDPHFVDAKPSYIVKLNRADALIEGGAELEIGWLPPLVEGARNPKLDPGKPGRISCVKGISLLEVPTTLDRSKGDVHAAGNPHYSTDPANAKIIADTITGAFCSLDPKSAETYRANLAKFTQRLDARLTEWRKLLDPYRGAQVVTYHNYWIYFARQFGLKMELFLEPKPGIPPTPSHLAEVVAKMKAEHIQVVVIQPYLNRKTAETVAGLTGATVLDFASFPGGGKNAGTDYISWMDSLVNSLVRGFAGKK